MIRQAIFDMLITQLVIFVNILSRWVTCFWSSSAQVMYCKLILDDIKKKNLATNISIQKIM